MSEIELIWFPGNCARVTLVALEEIGEPFTTTSAPLYRKTDPEFLALNPKATLPVLLIDGVVLTETIAIVSYLARLCPQACLLPAGDPLVETDALATMAWFASAMHPVISRLRFAARYGDTPGSVESTRAHAAATLRRSFDVVEERLADREWLYDEWSVVDAYLLWLWFRAVGSGMDGSGLVRLAAHCERCEARASVARALDREESTYAELLASGSVPEQLPPHQVGRAPRVV